MAMISYRDTPRTILDPLPSPDVETVTGRPYDVWELTRVALKVLAHMAALGWISKASGVYVARMWDDFGKVHLLADADDWPRGAELADVLEKHIDDIDGWNAPRWQSAPFGDPGR